MSYDRSSHCCKALVHGVPLVADADVADTLPAMLQRAAETSGRGLTLVDDRGRQQTVSYRELLWRAVEMGSRLRQAGLRPREPVMLLPRNRLDSIVAFWACVVQGMIPVPLPHAQGRGAAEIDSTALESELQRLRGVWRELDRPPILVPPEQRDYKQWLAQRIDGPPPRVYCTDEFLESQEAFGRSAAAKWNKLPASTRLDQEPAAGDTALLLFSSGSTSQPKGVIVTHDNIRANLLATAQHNRLGPSDPTLCWAPLYHVIGLMCFHLLPIATRAAQVVLEPLSLVKRPRLWFDLIDQHRVAFTGGPNFAFALACQGVTDEQLAAWDLSCLKVLLNGGEVVSVRLLERFLSRFSQAGLRAEAMAPAYGMSEATAGIAYPRPDEPMRISRLDRRRFAENRTVVLVDDAAPEADCVQFASLGEVLPGFSLRIVDPQHPNRLLDEREVGEIQIRGPSVTPGYYRNATANRDNFCDGWLRTGDLGFLDEGRLTIVGRTKDVLIVHGHNYYAHDLEQVAQSVAGVVPGGAVAVSVFDAVNETERAVLFVVLGNDAPPEALRNIDDSIHRATGLKLDRIVPLSIDDLPRTATGKVHRLRLKQLYEQGRFSERSESPVDHAAPVPAAATPAKSAPSGASAGAKRPTMHEQRSIERFLRRQLAEALGLDAGQIDRTTSFVEFGIDSVLAVRMIGQLEERLKAELPATLAFEQPTIADLAAFLLREYGSRALQALSDEGPPISEEPRRQADRSDTDDAKQADRHEDARFGKQFSSADDSHTAKRADEAVRFTPGRIAPRSTVDDAVPVADAEERSVTTPAAHRVETPGKHAATEGGRQGDFQAGLRRSQRGVASRPEGFPVAVVAMAGRFPGAATLEDFWCNLLAGKHAIGEPPPGRYTPADKAFLADGQQPFSLADCRGGFLDCIDGFDAALFGISPHEALRMDPQQRLLLETCWEAIETAGYGGKKLSGTATGVFVGASLQEYLRHVFSQRDKIDAYAATGNFLSILANRISYVLNLRGPSLAIDTACSSSLVALHMAIASMQRGECQQALVAGVHCLISPELWADFADAGMLAADGRAKVFDRRADGYVRGEGVGVVLLRRLSDALHDGDEIHAVVRGTAVNQDGHTNGLTAPSRQAQTEVIRAALQQAQVGPETISYIEAHGTGTQLGDPIELAALKEVFGARATQKIGIGSVKSNIGHLEPASGMAGLLKVVLALKHGKLPPSLNFDQPNDHVRFERSPFYVVDRLRPWKRPSGAPRRAGVSAFGFGGTNAHAVVEEAPRLRDDVSANLPERPEHVLTISARSPTALRALAQRYRDQLFGSEQPSHAAHTAPQSATTACHDETQRLDRQHGTTRQTAACRTEHQQKDRTTLHRRDVRGNVADICFTSNTGRRHWPHRLAITAHDAGGFRRALDAVLDDETLFEAEQIEAEQNTGRLTNMPIRADSLPAIRRSPADEREWQAVRGHGSDIQEVAFLYPGHGPPFVGVAGALLENEPVFRGAVDACDAILRGELPFSLRDILTGAVDAHEVHRRHCAAPAIFAYDYALDRLWRSWGIEPSAVLGQSLGEYVAACVAEVFDLETAIRLVWRRSQLLSRLPQGGGMLAVLAGETRIREVLDSLRLPLEVAVINGPQHVVVSGPIPALKQVADSLRQRGVVTQPLNVPIAFHSPLVEPVLSTFERLAQQAVYRAPRVPMLSNLWGRYFAEGEIPDAAYWREHTRRPVRFADCLAALIGSTPNSGRGGSNDSAGSRQVMLEVGPGRALSTIGRRLYGDTNRVWLASTTATGDVWPALVSSLATLYCLGADIDWEAFDRPYRRRRTTLPAYPFEHRRYWLDLQRSAAPARQVGQTEHTSSEQLEQRRGPEAEPKPTTTTKQVAEHIDDSAVDYGPSHRDRRPHDPTDTPTKAPDTSSISNPDAWFHHVLWTPAEQPSLRAVPVGTWVVFEDARPAGEHGDRLTETLASHLASRLESAGSRVVRIGFGRRYRHDSVGGRFVVRLRHAGEDLGRVFSTLDRSDCAPLRGIVHLAHCRFSPSKSKKDTPARWRRDLRGGAHLLLALSQRLACRDNRGLELWLVTTDAAVGTLQEGGEPQRDAQRTPSSRHAGKGRPVRRAQESSPRLLRVRHVGAAASWGFVRVVARELPDLRVRAIDLSADGETPTTLAEMLWQEMQYDAAGETVVRQRQRFTPRLVPLGLPTEQNDRTTEAAERFSTDETRTPLGSEEPIRLQHAHQHQHAGGSHAASQSNGLHGPGRVLRDDGVYLIVGGLGGVGLELARALAQPGRTLVLASRHALPLEHQWPCHTQTAVPDKTTKEPQAATLGAPRRSEAETVASRSKGLDAETVAYRIRAVEALRAAGATVWAPAVDITDRTSVQNLVDEIRCRFGYLHGVVHAAGVMDDRPLLDTSPEDFDRVVRPKIEGAITLLRTLRNERLDFFVYCSSAASLWGNPGQAAYAAANALLDALAHQPTLRRSARVVMSLAWSPWQDVGMAARLPQGVGAICRQAGIVPIAADAGRRMFLRALERGQSYAVLIQRQSATVGKTREPFLPIWSDALRDAENVPRASDVPAVTPLVDRSTQEQAPHAAGAARRLFPHDASWPAADAFSAFSAADRDRGGTAHEIQPTHRSDSGPFDLDANQMVQQIAARLAEEVAALLDLHSSQIARDVNLMELGFDSIMASRLAARLSTTLNIDLPATRVFAHPTVGELARYLNRHFAEAVQQWIAPDQTSRVAQSASPAGRDDISSAAARSEGGQEQTSHAEPSPQWAGPFDPFDSLSTNVLSEEPEERAAPIARNRGRADTATVRPAGETKRAEVDSSWSSSIAIVAMACRFPGASSPEEFWNLLREGRHALGPLPAERMVWAGRDPNQLAPSAPSAVPAGARWGAFLSDVQGFDAAAFGISPKEARLMDPQQRLMLELAWELFERAGYGVEQLSGSKTGVFVGVSNADYLRLLDRCGLAQHAHVGSGNALTMVANRVSYWLNLRGPSLVIDTACSSSLVAVHTACESLRRGESDMALAGGVNLILAPEHSEALARSGMLSPQGVARTFDRDADGYVRGEGAAVVLLKRLADAMDDGDRIVAVIRSSAVNHDGHSKMAVTAPNPKAQTEVIRTAWHRAGIDPRTLAYIEAHGTGTPLGDPIEIEALATAFAQHVDETASLHWAQGAAGTPRPADSRTAAEPQRNTAGQRAAAPSEPIPCRQQEEPPANAASARGLPESYCAIGSVKTNIGHLEAAAGIAGLLKVALAIEHGQLPPTLHVQTPNPRLRIEDTPFYINDRLRSWPGGRPAMRAAVSSFGAGGTNAHLVIEGPPAAARKPRAHMVATDSPEAHVLVLSARTDSALRRLVGRYVDYLNRADAAGLAELCFTACTSRRAWPKRVAIVARYRDQLADRLRQLADWEQRHQLQGSLVFCDAADHNRWADWKEWLAPRLQRLSLPALEVVARSCRGTEFDRRVRPWLERAIADGDSKTHRPSTATSDAAEAIRGEMRVELLSTLAVLFVHGTAVDWRLVETGGSGERPVLPTYPFDRERLWFDEIVIPARSKESSGSQQPIGSTHTGEGSRSRPDASNGRSTGPNEAAGASTKTDVARPKNTACTTDDAVLPEEPLPEKPLPDRPAGGARYSQQSGARPLDSSMLCGYLKQQIASVLEMPVHRVASDQPLLELGIDSIIAAELTRWLERRTGQSLPQTVFFDYGTLDRLAKALVEEHGVRQWNEEPTPRSEEGEEDDNNCAVAAQGSRACDALDDRVRWDAQQSAVRNADHRRSGAEDRERSHETVGRMSREAIAIVGYSGRFPKAPDLGRFWQNLIEGVDAVDEVPPERWLVERFYDPDRRARGKSYSKWAALLDDIDRFDASVFHISRREAEQMDPQQRVLLEVAWEALEHAGYAGDGFAGSRTGVFVGAMASEYLQRLVRQPQRMDLHVGTGNATSVVANRLSFTFDWTGPCVTIDTACSSSLVALHMAMRSLRQGECNHALVGATQAGLAPSHFQVMSRLGALSPTGRCRTFDARADGYVLGEGAAAVLLKPLRQALADGDTIHGVLLGSAVNHGGRSAGLTVPNSQRQADVIRAALSDAGIEAETLSYIEAHGTGTVLGDPIEIEGLRRALSYVKQRQWCGIGSVKSNIGHLEPAAGLAGLIKVLLSLRAGELPPTLHVEQPNRALTLEDTPLYIVDRRQPWSRRDHPRRAGISSFGFGGTNAHVIVEEPPQPNTTSRTLDNERPWHLLVLSAMTPTALQRLADRFARHLRGQPGTPIGDICYTVHVGRRRMPCRVAMLVDQTETLIELLERIGREGIAAGSIAGATGTTTLAVPRPMCVVASSQPIESVSADGGEPLRGDAVLRQHISSLPADVCVAIYRWCPTPSVRRAIEQRLRALRTSETGSAGRSLAHLFDGQLLSRSSLLDVTRSWTPRQWHRALRVLGELALSDATIDWMAFESGYDRRRVELPTYPFQRQRYWIVDPEIESPNAAEAAATGKPAQPSTRSSAQRCADVSASLSSSSASPSSTTIAPADASLLRTWLHHVTWKPIPGSVSLGKETPAKSAVAGSCKTQADDSDPSQKAIGQHVVRSGTQPSAGHTWVVCSGSSDRDAKFAEAILAALKRRGVNGIGLRSGAGFAGLANGHATVDLQQLSDQWKRLLAALEQKGQRPVGMVLVGSGGFAGKGSVGVACGAVQTPTSSDFAGLENAMRWMQLMIEHASSRPDLWITTWDRPTQPANRPALQPDSAAIWSLVRAARIEHPDWRLGCFSLEPPATEQHYRDAAEALVDRLLDRRPEAIRSVVQLGRQAWHMGVEPLGETNWRPRRLVWPENGVYLVTGGFGALGIEAAETLVGLGARNLVLVGRRGLPPESQWEACLRSISREDPLSQRIRIVRRWRQQGIDVRPVAADVADGQAMRRIVESLRQQGRTIRGVVHTAGVLRDSLLRHAWSEQLRELMRPKVEGLATLTQCLASDPLDFLVVYSSLAALTGNVGQACYAAANAWMDAICMGLRQHGVPAISLHWGPWQAAGMAASDAHANRFRSAGLKLIPSDVGRRLLAAVIQAQPHGWGIYAGTADSANRSHTSDGSARARDFSRLPIGDPRRTVLEYTEQFVPLDRRGVPATDSTDMDRRQRPHGPGAKATEPASPAATAHASSAPDAAAGDLSVSTGTAASDKNDISRSSGSSRNTDSTSTGNLKQAAEAGGEATSSDMPLPTSRAGKVQSGTHIERASGAAASPEPRPDESAIRDIVRTVFAEVLRIDAETLADDRPFHELGIDSLMAEEAAAEIQVRLGKTHLTATQLFEHPTIAQLSRFLAQQEPTTFPTSALANDAEMLPGPSTGKPTVAKPAVAEPTVVEPAAERPPTAESTAVDSGAEQRVAENPKTNVPAGADATSQPARSEELASPSSFSAADVARGDRDGDATAVRVDCSDGAMPRQRASAKREAQVEPIGAHAIQDTIGGAVLPAGDRDDRDIAIVGYAGRFPGAPSAEALWQQLCAGRCLWGPMPKERWQRLRARNPEAARELDPQMLVGAYLEPVADFAPERFGITPTEARQMDPRQRLFLEVANEALEVAGYAGERLHGSRTGVFVASGGQDYLVEVPATELSEHSAAGGTSATLPARLAYWLDLRGPCLPVDTACSSSLVALHLAVESLRRGECQQAVVGAVHLYLRLTSLVALRNTGAVSQHGVCRPFDAAADGFVPGEGVAAVLLKPLSAALSDGDAIYGVIRGSAVNNDGRTSGLTAPSPAAQRDVILAAWRDAALDPTTISYIETHGTGTRLGDPIELAALGEAFARHTSRRGFCRVGSIKSNLGHLDAAAGMAGLIKILLCFEHGRLPATVGLDEPNPRLPLSGSPLVLQDRLTSWQPEAGIRHAGISAFGFGGTNAHVVVEQPPSRLNAPGALVDSQPPLSRQPSRTERLLKRAGTAGTENGRRQDWHLQNLPRDMESHGSSVPMVGATPSDSQQMRGGPELLVLSADDEGLLRSLVDRYLAWLDADIDAPLADICFTAAVGRAHCRQRLAVVAKQRDELADKLSIWRYAIARRQGSGSWIFATPATREEADALFEHQAAQRLGRLPAAFRGWIGSLLKDVRLAEDRRLAAYLVGSSQTTGAHNDPRTFEGMSGALWTDAAVVVAVLYALGYAIDWPRWYAGQSRRRVRLPVSPLRRRTFWIDPGRVLQATESAGGEALEPLPTDTGHAPIAGEREPDALHKHGRQSRGGSAPDVTRDKDASAPWQAWLYQPVWRKAPAARPRPARADESGRPLVPSRRWWVFHDGSGLVAQVVERLRREGHEVIEIFAGQRFAVSPVPPAGRTDNIAPMGRSAGLRITLRCDHDADYQRLVRYMAQVAAERDASQKEAPDAVLHCWTPHAAWRHVDWNNDQGLVISSNLTELPTATAGLWKTGTDRVVRAVGCASSASGPSSANASEAYVPLIDRLQHGVLSVFRLLRAVAADRSAATQPVLPAMECRIVTRGAEGAGAVEACIAPDGGLVAGLTRAASQELAPMALQWIDLLHLHEERNTTERKHHTTGAERRTTEPPEADAMSHVEMLADELLGPIGDREVALGAGRRYVATTERASQLVSGSGGPLLLRPRGVYLITGGLGGVGLHVARWLAQRCRARLVLVGRRTGPSGGHHDGATSLREKQQKSVRSSASMLHAEIAAAARSVGAGEQASDENRQNRRSAAVPDIDEILEVGGQVVIEQADVTDTRAMRRVIQKTVDRFGRLDGVIHCAGVIRKGLLRDESTEALLDVLRPKVEGACVLDVVTRDLPLDWMVLFSSLAGRVGNVFQADYSSANRFLDSFAQWRQGQGRRTLVVDWGMWAGVGMSAGADEAIAARGETPMTPEQALAALDHIFQSGGTQWIVTSQTIDPFNQQQEQPAPTKPAPTGHAGSTSQEAAIPPLARQASKAASPHRPVDSAGAGDQQTSASAHRQRGGSNSHRSARLIRHLALELSRVTGLDVEFLDPVRSFLEIGLDSMLAIRFVRALESRLGCSLSATLAFDHPTLNALGAYLEQQLEPAVIERLICEEEEPSVGKQPASMETGHCDPAILSPTAEEGTSAPHGAAAEKHAAENNDPDGRNDRNGRNDRGGHGALPAGGTRNGGEDGLRLSSGRRVTRVLRSNR